MSELSRGRLSGRYLIDQSILALDTVWLINLIRVISQHKKTHGGVCHENSNLGGMYSCSNNSQHIVGICNGL